LYIDTFTREAIGYAQKLAYVDFDISINQGIKYYLYRKIQKFDIRMFTYI